MFPLENRSLLNEKILAFYQQESEDCDIKDVSTYYEEGGALRSMDVIRKLFPPEENISDIIEALNSYSYQDFLKCYIKLLPIFRHSTNVIEILQRKNVGLLNYQWMGVNTIMYNEMYNQTYPHQNTSHIVEHILILTSLLENALANIYYTETQGKQAPHLLRDLINTQEVRNVFGGELVILLKILMGSPNSINIRNVVWHGFPKPFEIPKCYESILLIIIHSMGSKIKSTNYKINERPLVNDFGKSLASIDNAFKKDYSNTSKYEETLKAFQNDFANDFTAYWQQIFSYYKSKRFIEWMILILPQIELLLRLHYGQINEFDISAKLDEYYITMDTLFETETIMSKQNDNNWQKPNKLLDFTTYAAYEGCFHLIYDIFLSPNGCRLRDKVSHGEVELSALNNPELASLVLQIFLNLLTPLKCNTLNNYESKLHLNCTTKQQLLATYQNLQVFNQAILNGSLEHSSKTFNNSSPSKVLIFQRPKKESEFMLLIKKVSTNVNTTLDNYKESIQVRSTLLAQRDLHSKRRKTLEKLLTALPEINKTLNSLWRSLDKLFWLLQTNYPLILDDNVNCGKTLRFLKHSLTISENLVKYAHYDSNEWIKSLELCRKYHDFHNKLYLYDD